MTSTESKPEVHLFNTLSRKAEPFVPLDPKGVGIYCCGPTVYNYQHIGNLRTYIFEDVLVRTLRYAGYETTHVMNITDVGHLVSDADQGEDKMLLAARREGKNSGEIAQFYTDVFFTHCEWLNIVRPNVVCKATEHVGQMIGLIKQLENRGLAYQSGGNVYFDVEKFESYGELARLDLEQLKAGARIEVDEKKHNPLDFALWFTKSKFEDQELQWNSPWGKGYPGWHIECSAMALKYLGDSFDIHCGGIDHIPVHHTNEIAQSEGATGKSFAQIWMHGGFLVLGKDKMSKSTGEFLTLDRVKERGFDPICYRLFCLSGNYRNELSWSWEALEASSNTISKLKNSVAQWRESFEGELEGGEFSTRGQELKDAFEKEIFSDLSMPNALAVMHQVVSDQKLEPAEKLRLMITFDKVLGLGVENWANESITVPEKVLHLAEQRAQARKDRDWAKADALRDEVLECGFEIEDKAEGFRLRPTTKRSRK